MLDQMSGGRLEIGVGRGRSPIELALYDRNVAEAQAIYEEVLAILKLAFAEERVTYAGKHFNFKDVPVELRPMQQPHPQFWYGVGTPDSAEAVGEQGFHGVTLAKPAAAAEIARRFYQGSTRAGYAGRRMGICRFVLVGDTDQEARALAHRVYPIWHASFFELFRRYGQKPVQIWSDDFDVMTADGLAIAGSPRTVVKALADQLDTVGANYIVGQLVFGDMSLTESMKSVGLFASEVMPELIGMRQTTRQKSAARV
jgi:alkanesulfonate monooxygenase SsuD/methylene tetrahydromethanopterin reductase-like flavin-dependent oxidoreductase (luciferase family)